MKIGLVLAQPPGYSETFFNSKIKGLQDRGFEVILFCQNNSTNYSNCVVEIFPRKKINPIIFFFTFLRVLVSLIPYFNRIIKWYHLEKEGGIANFLSKVYFNAPLLKTKLDWIHYGFGTMALGRETLAKAIGAKMAVSFRGFDIGIYPIKHPQCYGKLWKYLDKLHVISDDLHKLATVKGLPASIAVQKITPAIDVHLFKTSKRNLTPTLLKFVTVGRLHWKKGFPDMLLALKIIKDLGYDFKYHIIGEGKEYERIAYTAYELGLKNQVKFLGKLTREEVKVEVESASIYLQYSVQEGFCNSVLEAQALGKLCIVSNAEGLAENVLNTQTGWVVEKLHPKKLAEKMIEVIHLPSTEKKEISQAAIKRVRENFNIEKQQREFVDFYKI